jgi:hypothetical protein
MCWHLIEPSAALDYEQGLCSQGHEALGGPIILDELSFLVEHDLS